MQTLLGSLPWQYIWLSQPRSVLREDLACPGERPMPVQAAMMSNELHLHLTYLTMNSGAMIQLAAMLNATWIQSFLSRKD